jgi:hypothetical protein
MILIAAIGVAIGTFREAPELAMLLMIYVAPPLIVTELMAYRRRRRGEPMTGLERTAWFLSLTVLIPIGTILAGALALALYFSVGPG